MPTVTAISVAYNSMAVLPGMAASLPADVPLTVVNNGPDDGIVAWAAVQGIRLLTPAQNLGFGSACNLGAKGADSEFLLFINPDARLDADTLPRLCATAHDFPGASAFGPMLRGDDGALGYKRRSFLNRADSAPVDPGPAPLAVPSLSGAAMLIRRAAFEAVGGFDPDIFLYYEDDDLACRLKRDQGPLILVPAAVVHHAAGQSSAPSPALSRFKGYHWGRSRVIVARKHGLPAPWWGAMKNAVWHLIGPKSWTSPDRRDEAKGRIAGVWSMRASLKAR